MHSKLRKIESGEETSIIACNNRSSDVTAKQKYYKNIKKIKRNHVSSGSQQTVENPSKNYYLAFPALNHQEKKTSTNLSMNFPKNLRDGKSTDCWSNLITSHNSQHLPENGIKASYPVRRAPNKASRFQYGKNDMQPQIKMNSDSADNGFFNFAQKKQVVKKKQKHQRNNFGE